MTRAVLLRAWREGASILTLAELLGEEPECVEAALRLALDSDDDVDSSRRVPPSAARLRPQPHAAAEAAPVTPPAGAASPENLQILPPLKECSA